MRRSACFAIRPFDQVSIRDIAREAGISHASIYRYFPDQRALFVEAFLRGAEKLERLIDGAAGGGIGSISETYIRFLIDNDQYFRMMTHFMLDGSLSGEQLERLNATERSCSSGLTGFSARRRTRASSPTPFSRP